MPMSYVLLVMGIDSNATLFMPETLMFLFHFNIQICYLHCNGGPDRGYYLPVPLSVAGKRTQYLSLILITTMR